MFLEETDMPVLNKDFVHQVKVLKNVTKIFRLITNMHTLILFGCKALISVPGTTERLLLYSEDA